LQGLVDRSDRSAAGDSARHVGLVGHDDQQVSGLLEGGTGLIHARKHGHLAERCGAVWPALAHDCGAEDTVAVEENGAAAHQVVPGRTDSHLVAATLRAGWLTSRCQTTAARPSVCGVIRSGKRGGTTTQAVAFALV